MVAAVLAMDAVGVHQYWGFTPALNDEELWRKVVPPADAANDSKPLNVLLAQPGDIRHILKTIAERARDGGKRPINVSVPGPQRPNFHGL